jgi:iron complex outermembrane receptor protein
MTVRSLYDEPRRFRGRSRYRLTTAIAAVSAAFLLDSMSAHAQTETAPADPAAAGQDEAASAPAPFGEILVTATKRGPTNVQDVPAAITAFGQEQLDAENFRDISSLSYKIPNVQLDSMGVVPGFANFSIRGQGFTNSQLTLEPTVGIFVDGVYQGVNAGIITENFDLAGIEVLRGPQGLLFGRNVTGGAVLIRTTDPSTTLTGNFRVGIESGPNYSANGVVSGPIGKGVAVKLAMLYNRDEGYFTDAVNGIKVDRSRSFVVRPAILWQLSDDVKLVIRAEHGENEGNGPANKNLGVYSQDDFRFANNIHGPYWTKWDQVTAELNIGVGFGDGTITNIAGWRKLRQYAAQDSDSTIMQSFSAVQRIRQEQFSNELRYSGTFGDFAVTTGIFYFWQNPSLVENR